MLGGIGSAFQRFASFRPELALDEIARRAVKGWPFICLLVGLFVFPLIFLKEYHFEEGLAVAFATEALNGNIFYPKLYGYSFTERPVMMSWLIALLSFPVGEVSEFTARLPVFGALVLGGTLIFRLVGDYSTPRAAVFALFAFICSPLVIKKVVTAEPDIVLSVFQFSAFVLWWDRYRTGKVGLLRWGIIGIILAVVGAFKGPQPAAFFAVGIGVFHLLRKDWIELAGYAFAGILSLGLLGLWYLGADAASGSEVMLDYMRLRTTLSIGEYFLERLDLLVVGFAQFLPVPLILFPLWLLKKSGEETEKGSVEKEVLIRALSCYSAIVMVVLFFWPGANVRYAMPAMLGLVAIAGLRFDALLERRAVWARISVLFVLGVAMIQLAKGWIVAPIIHEKLSLSRTSAAIIDSVLCETEESLYVEFRVADSILAYMDWEGESNYLDKEDFGSIETPAVLLMKEDTMAECSELFDAYDLNRLATISDRDQMVLVRLQAP